MAFLNEYKRRFERRQNTYQVIMEDLVKLGIVDEDDYNKLIGRDPDMRVKASDYAMAGPGGKPLDTPTFTPPEPVRELTQDEAALLAVGRSKMGADDIAELDKMTDVGQFETLLKLGVIGPLTQQGPEAE
jgi:hypothetical protein